MRGHSFTENCSQNRKTAPNNKATFATACSTTTCTTAMTPRNHSPGKRHSDPQQQHTNREERQSEEQEHECIVARTPKLIRSPRSVYNRPLQFGLMCLPKKLNSAPMQAMLTRLNRHKHFDFLVFEEHTLFFDPVETWPTVDILLCFHSNGFPIRKAARYVKLQNEWRRHKGYKHDLLQVQDVAMQKKVLLNRERVYRMLHSLDVPCPQFSVVKRNHKRCVMAPSHLEQQLQTGVSALSEEDYLSEFDDAIEIGGRHLPKPFVEKPIDSNNHHITIYFPNGGGSRRLFRKRNNKSSELYEDVNNVRRNDSYLYEPFVKMVDAHDIKVYCVGPDYAYAERRKSPVVDGIVMRTKDGFEKREHVELTEQEKEFTRRIVKGFKQFVCGFDILRLSDSRSMICDVNGFSFVKKNTAFYDECAVILRRHILREFEQRGIRHE